VNAAKRFYHCFGCGRHGNAIGFLMEFAQLGFRQAVLELASRHGMQLPTSPPMQTSEKQREREIISINHGLQAFFEQCLPQCSEVLRQWGIDESTAKRLHLGYAPPSANLPPDVAQAMRRVKFPTTDRKQVVADRLVIPVRGSQGAVLGFLSTSLTDGPAGSTFLSGLGTARDHMIVMGPTAPIQPATTTIVVFSPVDWLQLVGRGISVALIPSTRLLGTHLRRLRRSTKKIVVCVPSGSVGDAIAVLSAHQYADLPASESPALRVLFHPAGESIGALTQKRGKEWVERVAENAEPLFDAALKSLPLRLDRRAETDRRRYLGHILRFAAAQNKAAAAVAVQWLVNAWNLPPSDVIELLHRARAEDKLAVAPSVTTRSTLFDRLFGFVLTAPDCARHLPHAMTEANTPGMSLVRELSVYLRNSPLATLHDATTFLANHPNRELLKRAGDRCALSYEHLEQIAEALESLRLHQQRSNIEPALSNREPASAHMVHARQRD
jgi:DNA primase